ncbi:MAG: hypothetical protein K2N46_13055 [Lachnospiraceae bacterium]|nr:hypothetical protein [Lachnospiraceae bacterium]
MPEYENTKEPAAPCCGFFAFVRGGALSSGECLDRSGFLCRTGVAKRDSVM